MTIRVYSFDFDGCLFNRDYIFSSDKDVIAHNAALLKAIKQEKKDNKYSKTIAFVGSNRQSYWVDYENGKPANGNKGSCFPAIAKVAKEIGAEHDTFLLADLYFDLEDGKSYKRAMRAIEKKEKIDHADWKFDDTKATIIYAQIHKIANENPNEEIIFDFFDDRGNKQFHKDILEWLQDFYSSNSELMPKNVTLRLNHYTGGKVTLIDELKGTGFIDANYRQTVKDMAEIAGKAVGLDKDDWINKIESAHHVTPDLLENRVPLETAEPGATKGSNTKKKTDKSLEELKKEIKEVQQRNKVLKEKKEAIIDQMERNKAQYKKDMEELEQAKLQITENIQAIEERVPANKAEILQVEDQPEARANEEIHELKAEIKEIETQINAHHDRLQQEEEARQALIVAAKAKAEQQAQVPVIPEPVTAVPKPQAPVLQKPALSPVVVARFQAQLDLIARKRDELKTNHHNKAAISANKLHKALSDAFEDFKNNPDQFEDFSAQSADAIKAAHIELDKHRGWKEFLVNLLCVVSVIGLLIKESVNLFKGNSFFFVAKTNSEVMLDTTAEMVSGMAP